jgi:excisionase family DNA binding protein
MTIRRNFSGQVRGTPGTGQKPNVPLPDTQHASLAIEGAVPFSQRLTCTINEACEATGLGRTKLYELIGAGALDTITVGRRRLVSVRSLRTLLEPNRI